MSLMFHRRACCLFVLLTACLGTAVLGEPLAPVKEKPRLAFDQDRDLAAWQSELRATLREILALPEQPRAKVEWTAKRVLAADDYTMDRVEFTAEPGQVVPGYLLRPVAAKPPYRVMICLQGHSPGMHVSIGRKDPKKLKQVSPTKGDRDFAIQAVRHGWAALAIEQRGFGDRAVEGATCGDLALRSFLRGRPLLGRRVLDVVRAVDFIATQPDLDSHKIACMGNSGGGTVSFFAGCVDERIRLVVDSCSFCTYADSWLAVPHCPCGYVPGLLKVADMPDLAGLIAPRGLIIVAGRNDHLARLSGVREGFGVAKRIYQAAGAADRVRLVVGDGGHRFYAADAWPVIEQMAAEWQTKSE
ncbi:MAG: acetylxylan esterase [Pirellulales bacterium]|nr:acetylxylan esterase [Pirellulales bacterium]